MTVEAVNHDQHAPVAQENALDDFPRVDIFWGMIVEAEPFSRGVQARVQAENRLRPRDQDEEEQRQQIVDRYALEELTGRQVAPAGLRELSAAPDR